MKKGLVLSQYTSRLTQKMYRRQMVTLAQNVFEFVNLPEYIDVSYLNKTLVFNGAIAFFKDEVLGVIALPFDVIGNLDVYGRPINIMVRAANGRYYRKLTRDEFVIMYDNNGRYPIFDDIYQIADRISLCVRTQDVNIFQQRTPRYWLTDKDNEYTVRNTLNDVEGFMENVLSYKTLDLDSLSTVQAPAPYVTDKIDDHLTRLWAEFFRLIGVANIQEQKKERIIVDEMIASQGGTIASRYSRFEPRSKAIKEINKKWGLDIVVRYYDGEPSTEEVDSDVFSISNDSNGLQLTTNTLQNNE